jgi:hypothetical protein
MPTPWRSANPLPQLPLELIAIHGSIFNRNGPAMTKLTTKTRNKIPGGDFALPGRRYPIEDKAHARDALSRVSQSGTPAEKSAVRAKVLARFPGITQDKKTSK